MPFNATEPDPFPGTPRHNPGTLNLSWSHLRDSLLWLIAIRRDL
jgi:hypothetical protein